MMNGYQRLVDNPHIRNGIIKEHTLSFYNALTVFYYSILPGLFYLNCQSKRKCK